MGARIRVFGRDFLIYDCDDFTKSHYQKKYGIDHFPNLTDRIRTPAVDPPRREVSYSVCLSLSPSLFSICAHEVYTRVGCAIRIALRYVICLYLSCVSICHVSLSVGCAIRIALRYAGYV